MKYLIVEDFAGQAAIFTFPRRVDHADMRDQLPYGKVLSAGYATLINGTFVCTGGCAELNVSSRPEDAAMLTKAFAEDR